MIKVYYEHKETRAITGIWTFDNWDDALPTLKAYEDYANKYGVKYYVEIL